jgi:hypothetical protein
VINGREYGIKEAAMRADWRELFPITACSLSQDALYSGRRFFKCSSSYLRRMERFVAVKYEVAWEVCRDRVWVEAACRVVQPVVLCVGVSLVSYLFMILVLPRW